MIKNSIARKIKIQAKIKLQEHYEKKTNISAAIVPNSQFRIFTENFKHILPDLRLELKQWALGVPYSSYDLPFFFDKSKFLSYRVLGAVRGFFFDRNQSKYFLNYDLGTKQPLKLSARLFLYFKRLHSLGRVSYNRASWGFFSKTLGFIKALYVPTVVVVNSNYVKRALSSSFYASHLDIWAGVFRKRFSFYKKLQVQSTDLDLSVSGGRQSFKAAFSQAPSPAVFFPVMPMRYHSFIIPSYVSSRRVSFPYRFFRYYHKYFLRRNY
jgi:hypothetical protein